MGGALALLARDDTLFGACHGLAEDLGFDPFYLRASFALALFWNPAVAAGAYAGSVLLVIALRWLVPDPALLPGEAAEGRPVVAEEERQAEAWAELARAA